MTQNSISITKHKISRTEFLRGLFGRALTLAVGIADLLGIDGGVDYFLKAKDSWNRRRREERS